MAAASTKRVAIVGGGMGGLAAAVECAAFGATVSLFEQSDTIGGKIFAANIDGFNIDMGPTVLTMRWVFDTLFRDAGLRFDDAVSLVKSDIIARHLWDDGSTLDLYSDAEKSREAIAVFADTREADAYVAFMRYARTIYRHAFRTFMMSESPRLGDMARASGLSGLISMFRIDPFRTMHKALRSFFKDPRLIQLFGRYATYYGTSPYSAPATLHLIAEVERQGVWLPKDGMVSLALALKNAAQTLGAEIHTGVCIHKIIIENGRVVGVEDDAGRIFEADAVVWNGDAAALAEGALGEEARRAGRRRTHADRSLSALVTAFVGRAEGVSLSSHNVFFSTADYRAEFDEILVQKKLPSNPAVYLRAQDRDANLPTKESERFFTIINAPAVGDDGALLDTEIERCIEAEEKLFQRASLKITKQSDVVRMSPAEFSKRFPHTGGSIYGPLTNSPLAALKRQGARTKISGLYLAGGSVHPGAGVPMAALSGRQAARAALLDLGLNAPSPLADTAGGMSTG